MKTVKTKGAPIEVLYMDEARRVSGAATRLLAAANAGNKCAMLVEAHALLGQVRSLAESLEAKLKQMLEKAFGCPVVSKSSLGEFMDSLYSDNRQDAVQKAAWEQGKIDGLKEARRIVEKHFNGKEQG